MRALRFPTIATLVGIAAFAAACGNSGGTTDALDAVGTDAPPGEFGDVAGTSDAKDPGPASDVAPLHDATRTDFVPGPDPDTVSLYDGSQIVEFRLTIAPAEWAKFEGCWRNPPADVMAQTAKCPWVHCSFVFGTDTIEAACRPKGNPASWNVEAKPQFVVKFNEWDPTARFLGMRRLNLEANSDHGAPIRDRLAMDLMRDAGIDASRVNFARLELNGAKYGLYQNIEPLDREFLEDHFANPDGNLFDEFEIQKTNEAVPGIERLWLLNEAIEGEPPGGTHAAFVARMAGWVDMDVILRIMAVEILLPTIDNFKDGGGNFYWYDEPDHGFRIVPWDMDDCMAPYGASDQEPDSCQADAEFSDAPSPLCRIIHETPAWDQAVKDYVVAWLDTKYLPLKEQAAGYCEALRPFISEEPGSSGDLERFDKDCARIQAHITARIDFLKTTLGR